ncbi:hypothetical protein [Thioalkalivibrio sp. XN279]|uniref:hypothetical protein n=1 Tax=Thioalkalivibrio sp. XN279 TaxID=2714953 RepID=UPI00140C6A90|nr:hypothetical protein [Thioalkalivibrio sp. XN279]NHA13866.1 hypothetical protein [Thioalkalivibrio sp. XN279]
MPLVRVLLLVSCLGLAACAATPAPQGLAMPAPHEARAASLLAGYLLGRGWTVALAEDRVVVAARGPERLELEPLLDATGLDRIIVWRSWPAVPGADPAALEALALELNANLNVGQFQAGAGELRFQSSLPFLDALEPRLLDAYLEHTGRVRLAVLRVQGERQLLVPVEGDSSGR